MTFSRKAPLILGLVGSSGAFVTFLLILFDFGYTLLAVFVLIPASTPENNTPTIDASLGNYLHVLSLYIVVYLAASILGFTGALASFLGLRKRGVLLLSAGVVAIAPLIIPLLTGTLSLDLSSFAFLGWMSLLFVAGSLALMQKKGSGPK